MFEILAAVVAASIVIMVTTLLSKHFSEKLIAASVLCSIAFIYVGFSLMGNSVNSIVLEVSVAVFFYFLAMIGYSKNNFLIAYGIVLHGIWDLLHQNGLLIKTNIPDYYPLFCLSVDVILGIYFFLLFSRTKNLKI